MTTFLLSVAAYQSGGLLTLAALVLLSTLDADSKDGWPPAGVLFAICLWPLFWCLLLLDLVRRFALRWLPSRLRSLLR